MEGGGGCLYIGKVYVPVLGAVWVAKWPCHGGREEDVIELAL